MIKNKNKLEEIKTNKKHLNKSLDELEKLNTVDEIKQEELEEIEKEQSKVSVKFSQKNEYSFLMNAILSAQTPSQEENIKLVQLTQNGDKEALNELLIRNGKLVLSVIRRYNWNASATDDLIQEGFIGLYKAATLFDTSYKTVFSTYAIPWIKQSLMLYIAYNDKSVKLPPNINTAISQLKKMEEDSINTGKQMPTTQELAKIFKTTIEGVARLKTYSEPMTPLDLKIGSGEDKNATIGDLLQDDNVNISDAIIEDMMADYISDILEETLNEKELDILKMRYGFHPYEVHTLDEIGKKYGLTRERIRQIEKVILKKLKHPLKLKKLKDCL